jgi:hypothetical protein
MKRFYSAGICFGSNGNLIPEVAGSQIHSEFRNNNFLGLVLGSA